MTWFDALILALLVGVLLFEVRQEVGRSLLDAVALLVAFFAAAAVAPAMTAHLHWQPVRGTEVSPGAFALCFAGIALVCLLASWLAHHRTRWSLEHYDLPFSAVFGLVVAVTLGHVVTDVTAEQGLLQSGKVPHYIQGSVVASELRTFRTYHYVVNTFEEMQTRHN